ncbi:MAG: zf-TFIIB domain-containing protein [Myxococcales bacterium]|nr:zf-TFIIB domain-containing protein [Myxococcota bacterium]MDW8280558.1 zf-TFIIB domain-containing protein [Myxococcales bacterium]
MSLGKPSEAEEEYFAREEAAKRQREALERARQMKEKEMEELRRLHYMKCPKCGFDLQETLFRGVAIDKCYHCHGMWFDEGELEKLTGHQQYDLFQSIVRIFRRSSPKETSS